MNRRLFTSESVTEGHPDKVADRISDSMLDAVLTQDPLGRVACETFVTTGLVLIGGEISTKAHVEYEKIARNAIKEIGYTDPEYGFHYEQCSVLLAIHEQSPDITQAVVKTSSKDPFSDIGAGDQGIMYGYASSETPELMPLPIMLAHGLVKRLAQLRKEQVLKYLRPDGKSQVTVEYDGRTPKRVHTVVVSTQHHPDISAKELRQSVTEQVIRPVLGKWMDDQVTLLINPSGRFVIGGPPGDTGMTGRKVIVDSYGGYGSHGGGAFSGKDPTKVDRSAAYMARYAAINVVAAGLAKECEIQISYAIGKADPISLTIDTLQTGAIPDEKIEALLAEHFDFRPAAIIQQMSLRRPIYKSLSSYGHFGRPELNLPWERRDKAEELRKAAGIKNK
ncbi:methionine adenosyltransferase [Candidatus Acetothermia bacterium]|nr:methionine adenosyltransferase [Candidatus Acetothermia bacterium]MBI3643924.1 methionine adenosyltransferase [Candidatus Acetothermia bacterium]